ncbi:MAG: anaerobic glycerol-3-phosphate dehydrogenase subunit GlpA [Bilophila sp.]
MRELSSYTKQHWDVVVIGGGATGAGVLRDLAMRGVKALLLEQRDLVNGTSSRFHGLLHSGARYAVSDAEAGQECIEENQILRRIGQHCVEATEGFFVRTRHDDAAFEDRWITACTACGIKATPLTVREARLCEPSLAGDIVSVYRVPDAAVDGFRLVWQNIASARRHGASLRTYTEVLSINSTNGHVTSVTVRDTPTGESAVIPCSFVVNAAGSWVGALARTAGLSINVRPDRGTLVAFNHRFTSRVINRLRKASDGDIFVPHGSITILGTTSKQTDRPDDTTPDTAEIRALLDIGRELFPKIDTYRILRAFAGTRPLYTADPAAGRSASRHFVVLDHETDGLSGMATICGGKLTTYRLMAQHMTDLVCTRLGVTAPCRTATEPLIEEPSPELLTRARKVFPAQGLEQAQARLGDSFAATVERLEAAPWKKALLCECERVTVAEFEQVASEPSSHSLSDIRRRTRMGMGTCQGSFCGVRGVGAVVEAGLLPAVTAAGQPRCASPALCEQSACNAPELLRHFQQERWYGIRPALWGSELREVELARGMYGATLNIDGADCA